MLEAVKLKGKFTNRYKWTAYLMIAPALVMLSVFVFAPLILAIYRSLVDSVTGEFNNFYNYVYILTINKVFLKSFLNVSIFAVIVTVLMLTGSFLFAHVVKNLTKRFGGAIKVFVFYPYLLSGIIVSVIFNLILNFGGGLITSIFITLGKEPIDLITKGIWPYICIIVPTIWVGFGYNTLVMLAGLLNIPDSYYEAAKMDGANRFEQLIHITIPNMKNYFILQLISLTAGGLQMFEIPMMITAGGPENSTMTPILFLVNNNNGSTVPSNAVIAGAALLMIVISVINFFVFKVVHSEKSQDA